MGQDFRIPDRSGLFCALQCDELYHRSACLVEVGWAQPNCYKLVTAAPHDICQPLPDPSHSECYYPPANWQAPYQKGIPMRDGSSNPYLFTRTEVCPFCSFKWFRPTDWVGSTHLGGSAASAKGETTSCFDMRVAQKRGTPKLWLLRVSSMEHG